MSAMWSWKAGKPRRLISSNPPLGMMTPHCQYSPRSIITIIFPFLKWPSTGSGSPGRRARRSHSTSMGTLCSSTASPARSRSVEKRPSAATTRSARTSIPHAHDPPLLPDQVDGLGPEAQPETGIALGLLGDEVEEVPLRHESDEFAVGGQVGEIRRLDRGAVDRDLHPAHFLVGQAQEGVEQSQFAHHLQGGRMDGVAPEVAEEIRVLFQDQHFDAGAGQQQAEHHPGGAAAHDAASGSQGIGWVGGVHGGPRPVFLGIEGSLRLPTGVVKDAPRAARSGPDSDRAAVIDTLHPRVDFARHNPDRYHRRACINASDSEPPSPPWTSPTPPNSGSTEN